MTKSPRSNFLLLYGQVTLERMLTPSVGPSHTPHATQLAELSAIWAPPPHCSTELCTISNIVKPNEGHQTLPMIDLFRPEVKTYLSVHAKKKHEWWMAACGWVTIVAVVCSYDMPCHDMSSSNFLSIMELKWKILKYGASTGYTRKLMSMHSKIAHCSEQSILHIRRTIIRGHDANAQLSTDQDASVFLPNERW